ncbi:MAG TPA: NAD(P)/FAD-dependent oxidoreductase [Ferrovibrio sp.]|uniref:FAD/NAD(P)-dependent oxidoreductase n=1 Tax=Ferrovibrio sp. TaxID=1917215 RepID=UPI002ED4B5A4
MTDQIAPHYDVVVVGGGPAGLAAATLTARAGLKTALFDEQPGPGGQIYRAITQTPLQSRSVLGGDYWRGQILVDDFLASKAAYVPNTTVWSVSRNREIGVSSAGKARMVTAQRIILATGAQERPFPVPGWTLPGVMTAGAAQILLKSFGLAPQRPVVLAGCGPLLWLLAWQMQNAGAVVDAILDTTPRANWMRALPHLPAFLTSPYFLKGLKLMLGVRRRVRVISEVVDLAAEGDGRVEAVTYSTASGRIARLPAETLLLHQGVTPNVNLAMSIGIPHRWSDEQACWEPELDADGNTAIEGIMIAGDGGGIIGARAAEERGRLAALGTIRALKGQTAAAGAGDAELIRHRLRRQISGRAFLDRLYRPAAQFRRPRGDTIVCRCEEVTARQVMTTAALGCTGPNQMKAFSRCGMGPCQGRLCGLTVTELLAEAHGITPERVGYYRLRAPIKPITLGELAQLPTDDAAMKAVIRT